MSTQRINAKRMSADEAASLIKNNENLGISGFVSAGTPKAVISALAERVTRLRERGEVFQVSVSAGASTSDFADGQLVRAGGMRKRIPFQTNADLRNGINAGQIEFQDYHLSHLGPYVRNQFIEPISTAVIEAIEATDDGRVYLPMSNGMSSIYLKYAKRIILEINRRFGHRLIGLHDIYEPEAPPNTRIIPIERADSRPGEPWVEVDLDRIVAVVETDAYDLCPPLRKPDTESTLIAEHVIEFLKHERVRGRLPRGLPYQSGVGNVANAVLACFAEDPSIEPVTMFTEVAQDCVFDLIRADKLHFASTTSIALSEEGQRLFLDQIDDLRDRFVIRPQEISNHPEVIRRLGLISMNTALELDIFGNVNSTHLFGSKMMNGIGGSADFCRNAFLPIFMTPSVAKGGAISNIVPYVTHVDSSEHSTQIVATEQGIADLRGLTPLGRARAIIDRCAHPDYREPLSDVLKYGLKNAPGKHTPMCLDRAFCFHQKYLETGSMK
ncbi:MAG: acetyl-CoA hydrolase [Planctomycetes bacterium]|nr:acetyl-CoA hydrolase [Planctomycetota bacterium]